MVEQHPEPERIEIELTSNAAEHDRLHQRHPARPTGSPEFDPTSGSPTDTVVTGPVDGQAQPATSDQRRLVVTAAVVGLVALLLGWSIGRAGGSSEVATTSATTPVTTERVLASLLPGEALPSASTTTTRPPRTTTTTTLAPPQQLLVNVDPRLVLVDLTLVAVEQQRFIVELDLNSATLLRRDMGPISADPGTMIAGDDWVTVGGGWNGATTILVRDDGVVDRVDVGDPWQLMWQPGTDLFWRSSNVDPYGSGARYEQVDLNGEPTGATIELPSGAWSWQADPLGGLIVQASGKLYRVDVSVIEVIGSGDLIGLSRGVALTRDCDAQLHCGLVITDRATGESRRLDTTDAAGQPVTVESLYGWGPGGFSSVSPDGSMAAVILLSNFGRAVLSLVDLGSGVVVELAAIDYAPAIAWSPDSRFAFFLGQQGVGMAHDLNGFDRESGEVFPVFAEPVEWEAMAARPRSG